MRRRWESGDVGLFLENEDLCESVLSGPSLSSTSRVKDIFLKFERQRFW